MGGALSPIPLSAPAPLPHHSEVFKHIVSLTATLLPTPNPHTVHTGTPALTQGRYRYFSGTFNSSVVECRWEAAVGKPPEPPGRPAPQLPACPPTFHDYRKLSLSKECIPSIISYSTNLVNQERMAVFERKCCSQLLTEICSPQIANIVHPTQRMSISLSLSSFILMIY